jgi:hypothetical protein
MCVCVQPVWVEVRLPARQASRAAATYCISLGVRERAPINSVRYYAFVDPSGGSVDSMTLAIGHCQDSVAVLDAVREIKPPFSPTDVVTEFVNLIKSYTISRITGDCYAGEWPRERFREHGITYEPAAKPKSDLYRDMLPVINSRGVDLLDSPRLIAQICALERRTARGGRDSIDHWSGSHDDVANCVVGLISKQANIPRVKSTGFAMSVTLPLKSMKS